MKKLVKLTALLLALAMCVFTAGALAESTLLGGTVYEGTQTNVDSGEYHAALTADELAAQALYEQIMASSDLAAILDMMVADGNNGAVALTNLKAEHLNGIKQHVDALYAVIDDPAQMADDFYTFDKCYEEINAMITAIAEDLGIELLAEAWATVPAGGRKITQDTTINLTAATNWFDGTMTIDGCDVEIIGTSATTLRRGGADVAAAGYLFVIKNGGSLTIRGEGSGYLPFWGTTDYSGEETFNPKSLIQVWNGSLTLENVRMYQTVKSETTKYTDCTISGGAIRTEAGTNTININNCRFENITTTKNGGAIYVERNGKGTINISNTSFINCEAATSGGAIFLNGAPADGDTNTNYVDYDINLDSVVIDSCKANKGCGSAIYMHKKGIARIKMLNCTVQNCVATASSSGTIRCDGNSRYKLTVEGCTIQNNTAQGGHGGGIYWNALGDGASLVVKNCDILNNKADEYGGGMFVEGSQMVVTDTTIKGNEAKYGGGIGIKTFADSSFTIESGVVETSFNLELGAGVVIEENIATTYGGGVSYLIVPGVPLSGFEFNYTNGGAIIRNNTVTDETGKGGGIAIIDMLDPEHATFPNRQYSANVFMKSGEIHGNNATDGGGIYMNMGNFEMSGGKINTHEISGNGGAVYIEDGDFSISDGEIYSNRANLGAGAYVVGGDFLMSGGTMKNNTSSIYGGAAYVNGGNFTMTSGTMDSNIATNDGGGVYVTGGSVTIGVENCSNHVHPVLTNNSAVNGGAVAVAGSTPIMYCGEVTANTASESGGAVYVSGGGFEMKEGTFSNNEATDGGAVYVSGGNFLMENGTISSNEATDGGAVYVSDGDFLMENGVVSDNNAVNGGAAYVSDGDFTMINGVMGGSETTGNVASSDGGAVYVTGGNFTMISGEMTYNQANGDVASGKGNGGAVLTVGGNIYIGVEGCDRKQELHTGNDTKYNHLPHPIVTDNKAAGCGGGLAMTGTGNIYIYCAKIIENEARNKGLGHNVYMENGELFLYDGANIGETRDPDMVIIHGNLNDERKNGDFITLIYHANNYKTDAATTMASAEASSADKYVDINLPDGTRYWGPPADKEDYFFYGWTFYGPENTDQGFVRNDDDYLGMGKAIEVIDQKDSNATDKTIHLYALWAPPSSTITYIGSVTDEVFGREELSATGNPTTYSFTDIKQLTTLTGPVKNGYTFDGWYIYQDEGQNANWGYEPYYLAGTTDDAKGYDTLDYTHSKFKFLPAAENGEVTIDTGMTRYGNITLIAKWTSAFSQLTITKAGYSAYESIDPNQTFLFEVTGDPKKDGLDDIKMTVAIKGDGSVTITELPVGDYIVEEIVDWSWRYTTTNSVQSTELVKPDEPKTLTFTNTREATKWLDGDCYEENTFNAVAPVTTDPPAGN